MLRAMTISKEFSRQIIGLFANSVARNAEFLFNSRNTTGDTGGPMYVNAQSRPLVGFADPCFADHRPSHFAAVLRPQHSLTTEASARNISNRDPSGSPRGAAGDAQGRCRRRIGGAFSSTKKSQPHQTQPLSEISSVVSEIFRACSFSQDADRRWFRGASGGALVQTISLPSQWNEKTYARELSSESKFFTRKSTCPNPSHSLLARISDFGLRFDCV